MESIYLFSVVLLPIPCALWAVSIAEKKGWDKQQKILALLAGLLFTFFGVLLVRLLPAGKSGNVASGKMKICPFCKEAILADATVCRYCQSKLD